MFDRLTKTVLLAVHHLNKQPDMTFLVRQLPAHSLFTRQKSINQIVKYHLKEAEKTAGAEEQR